MAVISWNNLATMPGAEINQVTGITINGLTGIPPVEGEVADLMSTTLEKRVRWRATGPNQCALFNILPPDTLDDAGWIVVGLLDVVQPWGQPVSAEGFNFRVINQGFSLPADIDSTFTPQWGSTIPASSTSAQGRQSYLHNLWFRSAFSAFITVQIPLSRTEGGPFTSGDISLGGIWMGSGFEFDGVDSNWQVGVDDASRIAESEGRQVYASSGTIVDTMQCSISVQDQEKSLFSVGQPYNFRRWIRETGISRPTVILPRTKSEIEMVELGIHGRVQGRAPRISHQGDGWHRIEPFTIRALR